MSMKSNFRPFWIHQFSKIFKISSKLSKTAHSAPYRALRARKFENSAIDPPLRGVKTPLYLVLRRSIGLGGGFMHPCLWPNTSKIRKFFLKNAIKDYLLRPHTTTNEGDPSNISELDKNWIFAGPKLWCCQSQIWHLLKRLLKSGPVQVRDKHKIFWQLFALEWDSYTWLISTHLFKCTIFQV